MRQFTSMMRDKQKGMVKLPNGVTMYWTGKRFLCEHKKAQRACGICTPTATCMHGVKKGNCATCDPVLQETRRNDVPLPGTPRYCPHGRKGIYSCSTCACYSNCRHNSRYIDCGECCPDRTICIHGQKGCKKKLCRLPGDGYTPKLLYNTAPIDTVVIHRDDLDQLKGLLGRVSSMLQINNISYGTS